MRPSLAVRIVPPSRLAILSCLLAASLLPTPRGFTAEGTTDRKIDELIKDLGSGHFKEREAATRALKDRLDAIPALRKERYSPDLEVRRRANDILLTVERKRALRGLAKAKTLGKAGRAVEVADRLAVAAKYGASGEEGWYSLGPVAERMITDTKRLVPVGKSLQADLYQYFPAGNSRRDVRRIHRQEIAASKIAIDTGQVGRGIQLDRKQVADLAFFNKTCGRLLLRGEEVSLKGIPQRGLICGMLASSGDVELCGAAFSLIVAGGDVKKVVNCEGCIVICDGDVELLSDPGNNNLIVARGNVTCTRGRIYNQNLVRSGHALQFYDGKIIDLRKDGAVDPLAFVKFFELTDVGLVAEEESPREKAKGEGALLKEVRKTSPFAKHLRPGDRIVALEKKKTPTTEIFRRTLRRQLAEDEPAITFTVRRGEKTMDVSIPMKN